MPGPGPGPDRLTLSLALIFDIDCTRRLRASGDSRGDEGMAKSGLVKVTPGELGERGAPSLLILPLPLPDLLDGVELSERNCSWLVARTCWTLAAQSSRSYNLCNNSLNVNG
jgi:hypothetical protein